MFIDFNEIFNPTKEHKIKQLKSLVENLKRINYQNCRESCKYSEHHEENCYVYYDICKLSNEQCVEKCDKFVYDNCIEKYEKEIEELIND